MLNNILTSFNWWDVVLIIVIIRAIFIGAVQGFIVEFFKLLGMLFATVLTLHYYSRLAEGVHQSLSFSGEWAEFIIFVVLWSLVIVTFKFIREGWLLLLRMEAKPGLSQWGGGFLGALRSLFMCGMLFSLCVITGNKTLNAYAENSVAGAYLSNFSPKVYHAVYNGVLVKFFPDEKMNAKALSTADKEKFSKKK